MIVYVVATFTAGTIFTKRSTIETYALRDFIEACSETSDRVVMFEMEWQGAYDKVGVQQTAYAKALHGDFVAIEERAALPQPEVTYHEPDVGDFLSLCELLPPDCSWGDHLAPALVRHIAQAAVDKYVEEDPSR